MTLSGGSTIRNKGTTVNADLTSALVADGPELKTRWVEEIEVTSTPAVSETITGDPIYGTDENIDFKVTFKQAVEIDLTGGSPILNFKFGDASTTYRQCTQVARVRPNWHSNGKYLRRSVEMVGT